MNSHHSFSGGCMKFGNESKDAIRRILVLFNAVLFIGGFEEGFTAIGILFFSVFLDC